MEKYSIKEGVIFQGKKTFTLDDVILTSKQTYCRYFSLLLFPSMVCHNVLIDSLKNCERSDYSIVWIQHTETKTPHYHFVIGFTSSYNQKKSIYQVAKELGFFQEFSYDLQIHFVNFLNHIEPVRSIKSALLYLLHLSDDAIKNFKKPYTFDCVRFGKNENKRLYWQLQEYLSNIDLADNSDKWSLADASRYLYDLVDKINFRSQGHLQRYVTYDVSITDQQRSVVLRNWRNFIFALQEYFCKKDNYE